jgi:hypothetical protein
MDWSNLKDVRDLLSGSRFCLKALEPPGRMVLQLHGEDATEQTAARLREQIAYLEAFIAFNGTPDHRRSAPEETDYPSVKFQRGNPA